MKKVILIVVLVLLYSTAQAKTLEKTAIPSNIREISKIRTGKALEAKDVPVRVQSVQFGEVQVDGELHLAAGIVFTKEIDAATVDQNQNIRLLREENGFWVDVSTQGNVVRIMPKHISWLSGVPLQTGSYRMHLRGTIKDTNGLYLDCNNDGIGEGGNLPAYDSPIYTAAVPDPEGAGEGLLELLQRP